MLKLRISICLAEAASSVESNKTHSICCFEKGYDHVGNTPRQAIKTQVELFEIAIVFGSRKTWHWDSVINWTGFYVLYEYYEALRLG